FFSSRRRHTRFSRDWSSDVCSSDLLYGPTSTLIAVEEAAREQGYFVSVATIRRYDADTMHRVLEHFMDQSVEGIVVIAPQTDVEIGRASCRERVRVQGGHRTITDKR